MIAKWGSEFLINSSTTAGQASPDIAALQNGGFVTVWHDFSATVGDTSGSAIRGQIYNAFGERSGTEFLINTNTAGNELFPQVASLENGNFVVTWQDGDLVAGSEVRAQIFALNGSPVGSEILVNANTADQQLEPAITVLESGGFVISWKDGIPGTFEVRAQRFDENGQKIDGEFAVSTNPANILTQPELSSLSNGGFVAVWETGNTIFPGDIQAQLFDSGGNQVGSEFTVNTDVANHQGEPAVTSFADGRFIVSWTGETADGSGSGVVAQIFNSDGSKIGNEFLLNTGTFSPQTRPDIVALQDGRFVAIWQSAEQTFDDDDPIALRGQVFAIDGSKVGGEFSVNRTTANNQLSPAITALSDGRFVVAFHDESLSADDASGSAIRGQIFDPRTSGMTWFGSIADDQFVGTFANDDLDGGFGNDIIRGGAGKDIIEGGLGNDVLDGEQGGDELRGGGGNDSIYGGRGYDLLYGDAGDDVLHGGVGLDGTFGGAGNDIHIVDNAGDVVFENIGEGTNDRVAVSKGSYLLGSGVDVELMTTTAFRGTNAINLTGNELTQEIVGNAGDNVLHSGGGAADLLRGIGGNDTYRIFNSADRVVENVGQGTADEVRTAVNYALASGAEIEVLRTNGVVGTSNIRLTGNEFSQRIVGNAGNNVISDGGGAGADVLVGLDGNDVYIVRNSGTVVMENAGQGAQDIVAASVDYALQAGENIETLRTTSNGGTASINLTGNEIGQTVIGNAGVNNIRGGDGSDELIGLDGDDSFVFFAGDFANGITDVIRDFHEAAGDTDVLRLQGSAANYAFADVGSNLQVTHNASGGTITINNLSVAQLDAAQVSYFT